MTHKELTIKALENYRGDDAERARRYFARYTPAEMQQEHGESGRTRAEVLASYEAHQKAVDAAIAWVKGQP